MKLITKYIDINLVFTLSSVIFLSRIWLARALEPQHLSNLASNYPPKNIFSQKCFFKMSFANSDEHNNPGCSYQSWGGGLTRWASKVVRLVSQEQSAKDLFLVLQCKAKQQDKNIFEWRQDSFSEVIDILKVNVKFSALTLMGVNVCSVREL